MFACAVPCYAETSNEDNFCISGISPLYELADTANAYLSISGTTASCQASDGVSGITVVQTLPKHKEQMIIKEFQINEYNNGDIYCLMIPTTSVESTMHYFDISKIRE